MILQMIVQLLSVHSIAQVKFPDQEKMQQFADMVQLRAPIVNDIIGFMDGVLIPAECTDKCVEQNAFYFGYDCDTMVNNVFTYGPDEKVFFAAINFPGSWANGTLADRDHKICIDQGFPRSGDVHGTLVGPITKGM